MTVRSRFVVEEAEPAGPTEPAHRAWEPTAQQPAGLIEYHHGVEHQDRCS